jgi:GMP synthase-like glutamine amidotransferase
MILYVDYEHASTYLQPKSDWLLAARARIAYRLQDISGHRCLLQRYTDVDASIVDELGIRAVFISGNGADAGAYDPSDLEGLAQIVRSGATPVFGFCGGFQFIGRTLGATLDRVGPLGDGDDDPHPGYQPGWRKELGYEPVELVRDHPIVEGLGDRPVFRHAHTWELKTLPSGFVNLARTDTTEIQCIAHETMPLAGAQFHPEYWTDEHPAGRRMIANFCHWAGLAPPFDGDRRAVEP